MGHRNTKKATVKGGFDRVSLFQNLEKGFDKLFGYQRQLSETFEYCNVMKNSSISDQLKIQEREINTLINQYDSASVQQQINNLLDKLNNSLINQSVNQSDNISDLGLSSVLGLFTPEPSSEEPNSLLSPRRKRKNVTKD